MAKRLASIGALVMGLVLAVPTLGQAPTDQQQAPAIRKVTRLVEVNVVVKDKKNQPVADLTRDDFVLLDGGQPQNIQVFAVESDRLLPAPEPLPPDTFANRFERRAEVPGSISVILLDTVNTRILDQARAKDEIVKFLKRQLEPGDRVALYVLGKELRILHDFTTDATPLLRSLARYRGIDSPDLARTSPEEPNMGDDALDGLIRAMNQHIADFSMSDRVGRTLDAFEAIANHLAVLPGRKNLVWVSGSFPLMIGFEDFRIPRASIHSRESRTFDTAIERAARALNDANLAIYPVDARGLLGPFDMDPSLNRPRTVIFRGFDSPIVSVGGSQSLTQTMEVLAQRTGGRAFYNTNDIAGAIRRSIEETRITYVLGYYPTHNQWDGKFREIKVQVKQPDLRLRYRRGYFALPDRQLDQKRRDVVLRRAAWGPLDATGVSLTARVEKLASARGQAALRVRLQVDAEDIVFEPQDDMQVGAIEIMLAQKNASGQIVWRDGRALNMRLAPDAYQKIQREGLILTREVKVLPEATQLRFVVRDATSGAIGSVTIPLAQYLPKGKS